MKFNFQNFNKETMKNNNIDEIKCSELIFKLNNKSKNVGFILFSILVLIDLILIIIHFTRGITSISDFVYEEMKRYNYIKKGERKFFEENRDDKNDKSKENKTTENLIIKQTSSVFDKKKKNIILNMNANNNLNNGLKRKRRLNLYPKIKKKNKKR